MNSLQATSTAAASLPKGPGGHGGGALSVIGIAGWALEWKHGSAALVEPFAHCASLFDVLACLHGMKDEVFLGLGLYLAILIVSTLSLAMGLVRIGRRYLGSLRGSRTDARPSDKEEQDQ